MNLHNMKDSNRSLHNAFCHELNTAWLGAIKDNPSYRLEIRRFDSLRQMVSEAKKLFNI